MCQIYTASFIYPQILIFQLPELPVAKNILTLFPWPQPHWKFNNEVPGRQLQTLDFGTISPIYQGICSKMQFEPFDVNCIFLQGP